MAVGTNTSATLTLIKKEGFVIFNNDGTFLLHGLCFAGQNPTAGNSMTVTITNESFHSFATISGAIVGQAIRRKDATNIVPGDVVRMAHQANSNSITFYEDNAFAYRPASEDIIFTIPFYIYDYRSVVS